MLKLKLQCFGHLMWRADSLGRPWCWEKLKGGEKDDRGGNGWMASVTCWTWVWASSGRWWRTGEGAWCAAVHGVTKSRIWLSNWTPTTMKSKYRTDFWTLWEKARVGCFKRTTSKHVYYLGWNRSPAQVGCMRQVLGVGALGRPRGIRWRGRWEGGSGWGRHVNPWLIHVNVWQKPLQYCKVISLQLIKINEKKEVKKRE